MQLIEAEREFPFSGADFDYLVALVYEKSGIVLKPHKRNMVYSRLSRRLRDLHLRSFSEYCELIQSEGGADEVGSLINAITTNLTKFFRESHHFDHLRDTVLKDLTQQAAKGAAKELRIWSAGCSSGEEPYSIAMTMVEAMPVLAEWDARILATDLDSSMIERAKAGVYSVAALTAVSKGTRVRHFDPERGAKGERWVVAEQLRRLITFKQLNLLKPWPMKRQFDAVFCRNVMIYFDTATKAELIGRIGKVLKPNGWLYLGHSESVLGDNSGFKLVGRTIYQKASS